MVAVQRFHTTLSPLSQVRRECSFGLVVARVAKKTLGHDPVADRAERAAELTDGLRELDTTLI